MAQSNILLIKETPTTIDIRARVGEIYKENNIQLSVMLGYYWENDLPVVENLLELFETVIKRTINEVLPHENLLIRYELLTDDTIEKATQFEIVLKEVKADQTNFEIDGKIISLKGINQETNKKGIIDSHLKYQETIKKEIKTEKKISFKEFARQQNQK